MDNTGTDRMVAHIVLDSPPTERMVDYSILNNPDTERTFVGIILEPFLKFVNDFKQVLDYHLCNKKT